MTTQFAIGNRVKIIFGTYDKNGAEGNYGTIIKKGVQNFDWIVKVEFPGTQSDDLGFNSDELELVEYEPVVPAGHGIAKIAPPEALSPLGLLAQAVSSSVEYDISNQTLYIRMSNVQYGFSTEEPISSPVAKAIWELWKYTRQWEVKT